MPEPKAINIAIFLDPVLPINGPLMVIPRSHTVGVLPADYDKGTTSYGIWSLKEDDITRLANEGGIEAPTGPAGSVLLFHGNIVHGSAPNITPYPRKIVYLTLNPVSNYLRKPTRPIWQGERDSTPIVCCDAGELAKLAAAGGQARL